MASVKRPLDSCQTPPSKFAKLSQSKSSPSRNFKEIWKVGNAWLTYESNLMFCDICLKAKKSNSFTSGCSVMKKESVSKHASNKEHLLAVSATKQSVCMTVAREAAHSKSEAAVTAAMKNVYFVAKQNIASSVLPELTKLMIDQGVTKLADLQVDRHTTYMHSTSVGDMQAALASQLEEELKDKILESCKFSIMLDESTDVSVHQNMIVYIRILEADAYCYLSPHTYFLGIEGIERANAECIYTRVVAMLKRKGIDIANLSGVSTDGAAVMVGNKSGVVTKLKGLVPGVLGTHCIAHRLALSCCNGADKIPYLVKFQEILNSVYKYFHYSPKNMATLESVQSLTPGQSSRFKQMFHTRWLSFEGSVDALVTNYSSLLSVFLEEKAGKSLSLRKPVSCYKFLYVAHFLNDCLKPLVILSKMYQKSDIDFSEVTPLLTSTISRLEKLRDNRNGHSLSGFLKVTPTEPQTDSDGLCTFDYLGHTIRDSSKQRQEAVNACDQFVTGMVKSLNERFSSNGDSIVLTALSNMFNPSISLDVKGGDIEVVSDYLAVVGFEGYRDQLLSFLEFAHTSHASGNKSVTSSRDMVNLAFKHRDVYAAAAEAAVRFLVAPVSTVDCERGFSKQNVIKTCLRNKMSDEALENLMRISIDGPAQDSFNFNGAFEKWAGQKSRRILN